MVNQFLIGVGELLNALIQQMDAIWALFISGGIISSFFAIWVIKRVLIFFDIIK